MQWVCVRENFKFSHLFKIGDVVESEENLGHHFTLLEGVEGIFTPTGRSFVVEGGRITGVWDG